MEQFQIIPAVENSYLARAGKNEFLNLVPDIEEIRPGYTFSSSSSYCGFLHVVRRAFQICSFLTPFEDGKQVIASGGQDW